MAATFGLAGPVEPAAAQSGLCVPIVEPCPPPPQPQCSDSVDNDGDGATDLSDPGCASAQDQDETSQCADGLDNDGDGRIDFGAGQANDPGCSTRADDDETDPPLPDPQCADSVDNDADGEVDSSDPGCASAADDDETSQCADGLDNDGDGRIDFGAGQANDPGCSTRADDDETDPPLPDPQCSDSVDNDADGQTDLADPGCSSAADDDETSQCADGLDNDGDGRIDFGAGQANDPGCSTRADDDETDPPLPDPQCSDSVDNDADGRADMADPGCTSAQDDDETSQCADGLDNDGDGRIDFGAGPANDPGCSSRADDDEADPPVPGGGGGPTGGGGHGAGSDVPGAGAPVAEAESAPAPSPLAVVTRRIAPPWLALQLPSGLFRDPLGGEHPAADYGPVMMGQALMREGRRRADASMVDAGVRAVSATVAGGIGVEENPIQLLAVASTYNWAKRRLASDPAFREARSRWEEYLAEWRSAGVGPGADRCFVDPNCFHNLDLLEAVAVLELFASGVEPGSPEARLADLEARERAIGVIRNDVYRAIGRSARAFGGADPLDRLGILSDAPDNPLAYHALSVAALARAITLLGDEAPPEALLALKRAIDATASFAAPDGDVAYVGRGSGAVWALAATVYAAEVCQRALAQYSPLTARRCVTLAGRVRRRIERLYDLDTPRGGVLPRSRAAGLDARSLDPYASAVASSGLAAILLEWALEAEPGVPAEGALPLPLDGAGAFHDPVATRFAVLRRAETWLAVHLLPSSLRDPRYDFGVVALKARGRDHEWHDVLPPRPLPAAGQGLDSAGPVLLRGAARGYPWGTRMTVDPGNGTITVHGGFRTRTGRWLRRGVAFRYTALAKGAALSFRARRGDRYAVSDYAPPDAPANGRTIRSPAFVSKVSPAATAVERTAGYASTYEAQLVRIRRTIRTRRARTITWTIAAPGRR